MKCLYLDDVKKVSFQEKEIPSVGENDVLVQIKARGICGTDLNSYRTGEALGFGHEMGGVIAKVGEKSHFKVGDKVFVSNLTPNLVTYATEAPQSYLGGFAEYILVKNPVEGIDLFTVPETMSFSEIALVEPFCVGMSGVKKSHFHENSKVVILGAGIIGMCAFEYLKSQNVKNVVIADINENRLEKAKKAGAIAFNSKDGDLNTFLSETFGNSFSVLAGEVPDVDVWIDAAGVGALVTQSLNSIKYCGEVVVLAVHHKPIELNLMNLMYNNVKISGSLMFSNEDIQEAIDIISRDHKIFEEMVSHEIPFENAEEAFRIADDADISLKVMMVD